jgi:hypothetical protein
VYALIVSKDGHKLREAVAEAEAPVPSKDSEKTPSAQDAAAKDKTFSLGTAEGQIKSLIRSKRNRLRTKQNEFRRRFHGSPKEIIVSY